MTECENKTNSMVRIQSWWGEKEKEGGSVGNKRDFELGRPRPTEMCRTFVTTRSPITVASPRRPSPDVKTDASMERNGVRTGGVKDGNRTSLRTAAHLSQKQ